MTNRLKTLARLVSDKRGATAIEYGLILGLMLVAIVAALTSAGNETGAAMQQVADLYPV